MLEHFDSFDCYATANIGDRYETVNGSPTIVSGGRNGTKCIYFNSTQAEIIKTLAAQSSRVVGVAISVDSLSSKNIIQLKDSGSVQLAVRVNSDGTFSVLRGTTVLATSSSGISTGTFYYLEFKSTIDNSTGSYELRLNGINILSQSSIDTQETGNSTASQVGLNSSGAAIGLKVDDFYITDLTGSINNDFLGDIRVEAIFPNGDNAITWDRSAGSTNYENVDETEPNDDTDYVYTSIPEDDIYDFNSLTTASGDVFGLQVLTFDRKTDAGSVQLHHTAKINSTVYSGATFAQQDTYIYHNTIFEENPDTLSGWTIADINSGAFGVSRE